MEKSMLPVLENLAEISAAEMPEGVQEQNPESVRAESSMLPVVSGQTELETGAEPGTEAADRKDAAEEPEAGAKPRTEGTAETDPAEEPEAETENVTESSEEKEGEYQVNIIRREELGVVLNHEDRKYPAGDTVLLSTGLPEGSLIAVGAMKTIVLIDGSLPYVDPHLDHIRERGSQHRNRCDG